MRAYEIVAIRHGTRQTSKSEVFATYGLYGEPDAPFTVDYYLWLLRSETTSIVVDTGFAAGPATRRGRSVIVNPLEALRELDVDPASGVPVIVTHGHYDHIGNLASFTHSPVYICEREYNFWTHPVASRPLFSMFSEPEEIDTLRRLRAEGRLHTFTDRHEVAPGVEVIRVGGHTPGQAVVRIATADGPVLLASDAAHFNEEIELDRPFMSMTDVPQTYEVLEWLRQVAQTEMVVPGHDAQTFRRFGRRSRSLPEYAAVIGPGR